MSWIDLVIAGAVILGALRGRSTGALRQVGNLAGLAVGFLVGTWVAPPLARHVTSSVWRPLLAIAIVVVCLSLGAALGRLAGGAANLSLRRLKLGAVDASAGAAIGVVTALLSCWLLAGVLVNSTWFSLSGAIGQSKLLAVLDVVMPPVPSIEAKVATLFRNADFPSVFATVVGPTLPSQNVPTSSSNVVLNALEQLHTLGMTSGALKIHAYGACGQSHEGSGFVVRKNLVITNAHVVAGATDVKVDGRTATPLVIDPRDDLAVLSVATANASVLPLAASDVTTSGDVALILGYPLDGPLKVSAAAVAGPLVASSRDIYSGAVFQRNMLVLSADVQPGNSGSAVMVHGQVVGVIFSKSTSLASTAYAIPVSVVRRDLDLAVPDHAVATGACVSL